MAKRTWILVAAVGFIMAIGEPNAFAQFGGRGLGGIFGGPSRTPRSGTQNGTNNPPPRPAPDEEEGCLFRFACHCAAFVKDPQRSLPVLDHRIAQKHSAPR